MIQTTFAMIKPDAQGQCITAAVLGMIPKHLEIVGMRMCCLTNWQAQELYVEHVARDFYGPLIRFITCSPVVLLALRGPDAIAEWRRLMGATDSGKAAAGTIRHAFGSRAIIYHNVVHGSDSPESATRELALFFSRSDIGV